ncbi:MAG: hypothetical protein K2H66_00885, partial [Oscillospiraceae bacterium]|nr:hypothetical protein [Oscillospiraceae bacterium]
MGRRKKSFSIAARRRSKKIAKAREKDISTYSQTVGDVTDTLFEEGCTELALYLSLELYSEEGFPEDFSKL